MVWVSADPIVLTGMNRIDRLFATGLYLTGRGTATAEDLGGALLLLHIL